MVHLGHLIILIDLIGKIKIMTKKNMDDFLEKKVEDGKTVSPILPENVKNYLIDIDGNGDVNGHTLIHSHTGSIADVDIVQSGINDQMINLTTSGDNHDIDISQTD